ncbi:hypothetical protein [Bythopirellula goksoeyrii]|uniref:FG-GAP repeat protein n=1 Tax=Bythopirellula goksoeyrii TaxID=1400387 RepID=A0A5B9QF76_9BACT|nr:hypothetical protein [Bythopirellula goksoeyrii]QEG36300.1 hypothetical protein Pr1d_36120 [Bythopirellula goksoeyrii]
MPQRLLLAFSLICSLYGCQVSASETVTLIRDDFSRYPAGPLSQPVGELNPAIQEYHYLADRGVPLEPWENAIGYLDSWLVGDEEGKVYLEQLLSPDSEDMVTRLFSPLFITGEPEWSDYTVEVLVKPLALDEMVGIAFRYKTNRHHYFFSLINGKEAQLRLRLPLDRSFRVATIETIATAPFEYDTSQYYRMKVEVTGSKIKASINGTLLLTAEDDRLSAGKVGVTANVPARFQDFHAYSTVTTKALIDKAIAEREARLLQLRNVNPKPKLWKKFKTPQFGCGRNVRFGDLDGDGNSDMLFCQNMRKGPGDNFVEISCLTAVTLDGKVLWQIGRPNPRNGLLTSDCPFQIHDVDGDGRNEVVMVKDFKIQVLDGETGELENWSWMPKVPEDFSQRRYEIKSRPHERNIGDSIAFFNLSGNGPREILVKDRYRLFWVFDNQLNLKFSGEGMLGHYPFAFHDEVEDNQTVAFDRIMIGYSMWDHTGKQVWTRDGEFQDHADGVAYGNFSEDPKAPCYGYYSGSDEGFSLIDSHGFVRRHHRLGHTQTALVAKLRKDVEGLQYACINFWKNPGIITILDHRGNILLQDEPIHVGSPFVPVNWSGDGTELILLSGNIHEGGMLDGQLRRVVMFPDDGHPDLCAAVQNLTGDARDEIILWDQEQVWIYTQERPFTGDRIYSPTRNPDCNDSNYRTTVSLPCWE